MTPSAAVPLILSEPRPRHHRIPDFVFVPQWRAIRQLIRPRSIAQVRQAKGIAEHPAGFGIYRFKYPWSEGEYVGVMAQELLRAMPRAVVPWGRRIVASRMPAR